jgi:hypothetical protein
MTREQSDALAHYFAYLYDRWQDERQYEDFADYRVALDKRASAIGATVRSFTRQPFRAEVIDAEAVRYVFKATADSVTVHAMI